jgi:hypothetical protein
VQPDRVGDFVELLVAHLLQLFAFSKLCHHRARS